MWVNSLCSEFQLTRTLMSSSRAVGFPMPSGTHFLWAGSSSSFPKRFHSPSSSKVVSTCWGAITWAASSSLISTSLNSIFSFSVSLSTPLEVPFPVCSVVSRSAGVSPEKRGAVGWRSCQRWLVSVWKTGFEDSHDFLCSSVLTYA